MGKQNLLGFTLRQMEELFERFGERPYRGKQLFKWLYNDRQYDFSRMTDFTKAVRAGLDEAYEFRGLRLERKSESSDGTVKFLFGLDDGCPVETVLIPDRVRRTICLSSQSGCALGCRFCATGTMGLKRNLTVGEMVGQLMYVRENYGEDAFTNVVFMGMGEPFNNYDNLVEALRIMTESLGLGIAARKITISTVGITPVLCKYADSGLKANVAVSLETRVACAGGADVPTRRTYGSRSLLHAEDATPNHVRIYYLRRPQRHQGRYPGAGPTGSGPSVQDKCTGV